jgi:hypothetical protein
MMIVQELVENGVRMLAESDLRKSPKKEIMDE